MKALQARIAERRKAAEPKAEAAAKSLVGDLKAYVVADGKGPVGDQFGGFRQVVRPRTRRAGHSVGEIAPVIDDYGDAKAGAAVTSEVLIESKKDASSQSHCLVFAWIEGSPRKNAQTFSCDDIAGVEKWEDRPDATQRLALARPVEVALEDADMDLALDRLNWAKALRL